MMYRMYEYIGFGYVFVISYNKDMYTVYTIYYDI